MQRILILIVAFGLIGLVAMLVTAFLRAVITALRATLRGLAAIVLAGAIAISGGVLASLLLSPNTVLDPQAMGILAGVLLFLAMLARTPWHRKHSASVPASSTISHPSIDPAPEGIADHALTAAWREADRLAPSLKARRAAVRMHCVGLLQQADTEPLDIGAVDCAVVVRRRVPELVSVATVLWENASRDERRRIAIELVESLEEIGGDADRHRQRSLMGARARFYLLRTHIANRMRGTEPL